MRFHPTSIPGAWLIELEKRVDERGFFARSWCQREFTEHGLNPRIVQCNVSFNERRGTLRGMHLQSPPHEEAKLVRCTQGAVFDVIIDLRRDSAAYKRHYSVELTAENRLTLFIPEGLAHGFQTLKDATEVFYQMSEFYTPSAATRGIRWNDPQFGVAWPVADPILSDRDRSYPDFAELG